MWTELLSMWTEVLNMWTEVLNMWTEVLNMWTELLSIRTERMNCHSKVFSKYRLQRMMINSVGSVCIKMGKMIDTIKKCPNQTWQASKSKIIKMVDILFTQSWNAKFIKNKDLQQCLIQNSLDRETGKDILAW